MGLCCRDAWVVFVSDHDDHIRDWLDSWRLAAAAAVFLAIILGLWSIKLTVDTRNLAEQNQEVLAKVNEQADAVANVQQARIQADKAARQDQVNNCFSRNATIPGVVALLDALGRVVVDPLDKERIRNYIEVTRDQTPTHRECIQLAKNLHVPVPKVDS